MLIFLSSSSVGIENSDSAESSEIRSESESITCLWLNFSKYLYRSVNKYLDTVSKFLIFRMILVTSISFWSFFSAKNLNFFYFSSTSWSKQEMYRLKVRLNYVLYLYLEQISSTIGAKPLSLISLSIRFCVIFDSSDRLDFFSSMSESKLKFLKSFRASESSFTFFFLGFSASASDSSSFFSLGAYFLIFFIDLVLV